MKSSRNKFVQENMKNKNARIRIRSWIVSRLNLTRVRLRCVTLVIKKPLGGASWPRRGGPETGNHLCQTLYLCCLCSSFFFAKFSCSKSADFSLVSAFTILTISSTKKIYFSFLVLSLFCGVNQSLCVFTSGQSNLVRVIWALPLLFWVSRVPSPLLVQHCL